MYMSINMIISNQEQNKIYSTIVHSFVKLFSFFSIQQFVGSQSRNVRRKEII